MAINRIQEINNEYKRMYGRWLHAHNECSKAYEAGNVEMGREWLRIESEYFHDIKVMDDTIKLCGYVRESTDEYTHESVIHRIVR